DLNGTLFTFGAGTYTYNFSGGAGIGNAVLASGVTVQVQTSVTDPGFQFIAGWAVGGAQTGDLTLQYTASAPGGSIIDSATFTTTTTKHGLGTVTGASTVTNGVPPGGYLFPPGGVPIPVLPNLSTVVLTA